VEPRSRAVAAAAVLLLGVAFCFVTYWWQLRYQYAGHGLGLPVFAAIPFAGLAVLVIFGLGRAVTALSWIVLAAITACSYLAAATSASSTAALAFGVPYILFAIVVFVVFPIDTIVRAWEAWRR
jgi:hypothetical protein